MPGYSKLAIMSLLLFIFAIPSSAEFYQYIDNKGITHFTDKISTIPATYQPQVNREHKRNSLPEELPYPEHADNDLKESDGQSITAATFSAGIGSTEKTAVQKMQQLPAKIPSKIPIIKELQLEKSRLLEQKKVLEQKFDMLMAEKQQIENRKGDLKNKENILLYNQNVKKVNKRIRLYREEENHFMEELARYNKSIEQ